MGKCWKQGSDIYVAKFSQPELFKTGDRILVLLKASRDKKKPCFIAEGGNKALWFMS